MSFMRRLRSNLAQEAGQAGVRSDVPSNNAYTDLHFALQSADLATAPLCVVTGFGPFQSIAVNPSEVLANKVCDLAAELGLNIMSRILAVTPAAVDEFIAEMRTLRPRCIIAMGVTPNDVQFEHSAQNALYTEQTPAPQQIDGTMPLGERIPSDLAVDDVERALAASRPETPHVGDVQTVTSATANGGWFASDSSAYLCNYMNFRLAQTFGPDDDVEAGFCHINEHTPPAQIMAIIEAIANARIQDD